MEDSKVPDFMSKFTEEQKQALKKYVDENPVKTYNPQSNFESTPKKAIAQLEHNYKKKSIRDTVLFWLAVSSILVAISSLIVSIIALKK